MMTCLIPFLAQSRSMAGVDLAGASTTARSIASSMSRTLPYTLLPRTSPEEARASAERILDRFRSELAAKLPQADIASLSIGLASRQEDLPTNAEGLVQLADEALYLAKAGGKNRITVVQPVPI